MLRLWNFQVRSYRSLITWKLSYFWFSNSAFKILFNKDQLIIYPYDKIFKTVKVLHFYDRCDARKFLSKRSKLFGVAKVLKSLHARTWKLLELHPLQIFLLRDFNNSKCMIPFNKDHIMTLMLNHCLLLWI